MISVQIDKSVFNDVYLPFLDSDARYLVFYGGGSSGKSFFIVQRYIYKLMKQKMNLLVVRQTGVTNRDSTFALFKQVIKQWKVEDLFDVTDLRIKCKNGNEVIFRGLDDSEKIKSTTFENGELTDIWVEEATETLEKDINQLKVRLRGGKTKKQMVLSFNPVNIKAISESVSLHIFSTYFLIYSTFSSISSFLPHSLQPSQSNSVGLMNEKSPFPK